MFPCAALTVDAVHEHGCRRAGKLASGALETASSQQVLHTHLHKWHHWHTQGRHAQSRQCRHTPCIRDVIVNFLYNIIVFGASVVLTANTDSGRCVSCVVVLSADVDWRDVYRGGVAGVRRERAGVVPTAESRGRSASRHLRAHLVRRLCLLRKTRRPQGMTFDAQHVPCLLTDCD